MGATIGDIPQGGKERSPGVVDLEAVRVDAEQAKVRQAYESGKKGGIELGRIKAFMEAATMIIAVIPELHEIIFDNKEAAQVNEKLNGLVRELLNKK